MTAVEQERETRSPTGAPGSGLVRFGASLSKWVTTTDHKVIGNLYMVTAFGFFLAAGIMAMFMRAELARPGLQIMTNAQYNQLFTVHGTIMMLLFATPMFAGFGTAATSWSATTIVSLAALKPK